MTTYTAERLYELLPAIYRLRDAEQGYPLLALLAVIAREIGVVEEDIARLYANWFIETSDEWVVPYIGDLLGVRGLHALDSTGFTRRAFVANTLGYRRRKGTPTMLEQLARDTTQWNARVVEFFELLGTTQYLNHLRPENVRTPDLRQTNALELLDTPFDGIGHTADVRRIASGRGKHNIPNVGILLWRLQAYYQARGTPSPVADPADGRYTFSPLGNDMPLFNRPQTETTIMHLAEEINVPGRLRRRALYDDLENYRQVLTTGKGVLTTSYFSPRQPVLQVYFDQPCVAADPSTDCVPLRPEEIVTCDLSGWAAAGWQPPASQTFARKILKPDDPPTFETKVAVDPVLGRLAVLKKVTNPPTKIEVSYAYGFSGDLGGGPYDRQFVPKPDDPEPSAYQDTVAAPDGLDALLSVSATAFATITLAIEHWQNVLGRPNAVIQIDDSRTYQESLAIDMAATDLVIQAANGQRPALLGDLTITGNQQGRLALNGLLIAGTITLKDDESLRQLDVIHCTLVPGVQLQTNGAPGKPAVPSIVAGAANKSLQVNVIRSIAGPLRLPANLVGLQAQDSIVESPLRGHPAGLTPVLVSGSLSSFPAIVPIAPRVRVTLGGDGPYIATLAAKPATLVQARDLLQTAIRGAAPGPAFTGAQVIAAENRLILLPGIPDEVSVETADNDDTADRLRLTQGTGELRMAVVSGDLSPFPALTAPAPTLAVTLGDETRTVTLAAVPTSLAQARDGLRNAIRNASSSDAFRDAIVGTVGGDEHLVIIPGVAGIIAGFDADATSPDVTTLAELRLAHELYLPAIGADRSGAQPGPATTLERVTVLGPVHVKELALASEVIFSDQVHAVRRQAGCVRFSYVPPGSQTPRRYRCQPELAIAKALEQAKDDPQPSAAEAIRSQILGRLVPAFTSTRYGDPAYGQLSPACPPEIGTGAEDGSEMGAFSFLKQPQRVANLQSNLEEYLRFGLEAGIFFVS